MPDSVWHAGTTLRQWRLQNFKSVREATVDLAPLTVVVGENSAGKSTLLQSIRVVAQAGDTVGSVFPLNGDQVRLGTYRETVSAGSPPDAQIGIGGVFHIGDRIDLQSPVRQARVRRALQGSPGGGATLDWWVRLGGSPAEQPGQTLLQGCDLDLSIDGTPMTAAVHSVMGGSRPGSAEPTYVGTLQSGTAGAQELVEVDHRGAFPVRGFYDTDLVGLLAQQWVEAAQTITLMAMRGASGAAGPELTAQELAQRAAKDVEAVGAELQSRLDDDAHLFRSPERQMARLFADRLADQPRFDLKSLLAAQDHIVASVRALLGDSRRTMGTAELPDFLRESTTVVQDFLGRRVIHLGPLRIDPQVVYTTAPVGRSGYIGTKGEYTAAVLQSNGRQLVRVPLPGGQVRRVPLGTAVNRWATFLGIGQEFTTADRGRLGLELAVRQPHVDMSLDLTSVGTGVSQLLPVLVMCLQSAEGSLLLLEQPELHLNPAVQQRLADFLLAIADSGRQMVVETHSDYLVSRLRRRVAESPDGRANDLVVIVFAERHDGVTRYTSLRPSPDGSLPGWPRGFFDQAAEDAEALLVAGLRHRRAVPTGDALG